jgi:chromatin segregation and condensation protein Rec8/ScpA/Scc1 (kleisin family)
MALAKFAEDNGAAIALLPPTTAHRLAAKSAPPEIVSKVVAKALTGEVLPDRAVAEMLLAAKSQKERTQLPEVNGFPRFKHYRKYCEPQEAQQGTGLARQNREKKTSEAAETLLKSLGADGVALVIKVFAEEEWPWGLLSELRKKILLRKRAADCAATH